MGFNRVLSGTWSERIVRNLSAGVMAVVLTGCLSVTGGMSAWAADPPVPGTPSTIPAAVVPTNVDVVAATGNRYLVTDPASAGTDGDGAFSIDGGKTWAPVPAGITRVDSAPRMWAGFGGVFAGLDEPDKPVNGANLAIVRWDPATGNIARFPISFVLPPGSQPDDWFTQVSDFAGGKLALSDGRIFDISGNSAVELHPNFATTARLDQHSLTDDGSVVVAADLGSTARSLRVARTDGSVAGATVAVPGLLKVAVTGHTIYYLRGSKAGLQLCHADVSTPSRAKCRKLVSGDFRPGGGGLLTLATSGGAVQVTQQPYEAKKDRLWQLKSGKLISKKVVSGSWRWAGNRDAAVSLAEVNFSSTLERVSAVSKSGKAKPLFTMMRAAVADVLAVSAGRVTYVQDHRTKSGYREVLATRTVNPDGSLGAETRLVATDVAKGAASGSRTAVVTDGKRATLRFFDGGAAGKTRTVPTFDEVELSGPYARADAAIYRADGVRMRKGTTTALFGSLAVVPSASVEKVGRTFVVRDLAKPSAPPISLPLPSTGTRIYANAEWRMWGDWVSAPYRTQNPYTHGTVVLNYRTGEVHEFTNSASTTITVTALGDGWVGLVTRPSAQAPDKSVASLKVLATGAEVTLACGSPYDVVFGGGRVVACNREFLTLVDAIFQPSGLPTAAPRLLGSLAPSSFTAGKKWALQLDLTKAVNAGTVQIKNAAGVVVRTLATKASSQGSLRGVTWNGRDGSGKKVPAGTYTWTLSVAASDGSGTAVPVGGAAQAPSGTVTVKR